MADLVTTAELAAYLQRTLDATSSALAVTSASAMVRTHCGQQLTAQTYTSVSLPVLGGPRGYRVRIPQRPVTAVTSIAIYGKTLVDGTDYAWDGATPAIDVAAIPSVFFTFAAAPRAVVTYTAGYSAVPADVKAVTLSIAGRLYDNPRGIRTRVIGDYQETLSGTDDMIASRKLSHAEKVLLSKYRISAGSIGGGSIGAGAYGTGWSTLGSVGS